MPRRPRLPDAPQPELSEIGRIDDACPYCEKPLAKRPERKTACPHCGEWIYVRSRPLDRERVLLTGQQTMQLEAEWSRFQAWAKRVKFSAKK